MGLGYRRPGGGGNVRGLECGREGEGRVQRKKTYTNNGYVYQRSRHIEFSSKSWFLGDVV